jgi:hypothetical protein
LGAPGAGKTTALLELARELVNRAKNNASEPIPVWLKLSSWKDDKQTIAEWLVAQLKSHYGVSKDIGEKWLKERQLLPLLDGLDELESISQEKCVQAINQFLSSEEGSLHLVVCSRLEEYELYTTKLNLNEAICLLPLNDEQIRKYLENVKRSLLWQRFQDDQNLLELAKAPLFISIISFACNDEKWFKEWQKLDSHKKRRQYLFNSYIKQRLEDENQSLFYGKRKEPRPEKTLHWLVWLAKRMQEENQTEFLIEQIKPNWLQTPNFKKKYRIVVRLIIILVFGLIDTGCRAINGQVDFTISGLVSSIFAYFLISLNVAIETIELVETLKWPIEKTRKLLIVIVIMLIFFGTFFWIIIGQLKGIIFGMVIALLMFMTVALKGPNIKIRKVPNQGIWRSAINGIIFTVSGCLAYGLTSKITNITPATWVMLGVVQGLFAGGLACIQHFALRLILWWNGDIPWNYALFLKYATKRMFLQEVGGRYQFIHKLLQEHFAELHPNQK